MIKFEWEDYLSGNMGGFNKKIAEALSVADLENREKLKSVYPKIYEIYMEWLQN